MSRDYSAPRERAAGHTCGIFTADLSGQAELTRNGATLAVAHYLVGIEVLMPAAGQDTATRSTSKSAAGRPGAWPWND